MLESLPPIGPATTINEVVERLDAIIDWARRENSRFGYFAALYRQVTIRVRDGVAAGEFEEAVRMEKLDVLFANRYFEALERYRKGEPPTESWKTAFESAKRWHLLILQHLLLGINAHINLDLGVAAAETSPGVTLPQLKGDFDKINAILASMVDGVQEKISELSPGIKLLDALGGRSDEQILNFSIELARKGAWKFAGELAANTESWPEAIAGRDGRIARLAKIVRFPGRLLSVVAFVVRFFESSRVNRVIDELF